MKKNIKNQKIFLSLGVFIAIGAPISAIVSCGGNQLSNNLKNYKSKNISLKEFMNKGGIAGDEAKKNNYALLKDFVFSLTNEKGQIFNTFKTIINNLKIEKTDFSRILDEIKKINDKNLFESLKILHSKGLNVDKEELKPLYDLIAQFVKDPSTIEYYINFIVSAINSNGLKNFIDKNGGIFELIKKIVGQIPDSMKNFINNWANGFSSTSPDESYYNYIINDIKSFITPLITNTNIKKAIGLDETNVSTKSLIGILIKNVFVKATQWKEGELQNIDNNKENIKAKSPYEKELLKKYLDHVIEKSKYVASKVTESNVPLIKGKGILNSSKEELSKNLLFFQSLLQKFLLYFGTSQNADSEWKSNIDITIENMVSLVAKREFKKENLSKFKNKFKSLVFNPILWKLATTNLEEYSGIIHKLIHSKLNLTNFELIDIKNIFKFVYIFLDKKVDKEALVFSNNEVKVLLNMILNGLNKGANLEKAHAKLAIGKILKIINPKLAIVWDFVLKDWIFGKDS